MAPPRGRVSLPPSAPVSPRGNPRRNVLRDTGRTTSPSILPTSVSLHPATTVLSNARSACLPSSQSLSANRSQIERKRRRLSVENAEADRADVTGSLYQSPVGGTAGARGVS